MSELGLRGIVFLILTGAAAYGFFFEKSSFYEDHKKIVRKGALDGFSFRSYRVFEKFMIFLFWIASGIMIFVL
jgi:hypothetical protein